jgi:hypothetical protein
MTHFKLSFPVSKMIFRLNLYKLKDKDKHEAFFALEDGSIYIADDVGRLDFLIKIENVINIRFSQDMNLLFIIQKDLTLTRFDLQNNQSQSRVKIGGFNSTEVMPIIEWFNDTQVLFSINNKLPVILDLENDETRQLPIPELSNSNIKSINFSSILNILCVVTLKGDIILLQKRKKETDEIWELLHRIQSSSAPEAVYLQKSFLLVIGQENVQSFSNKEILNSNFGTELMISESAVGKFKISRQNGNSVIFECEKTVKSVRLSSRHLACWDGSNLHIWSVEENLNTFFLDSLMCTTGHFILNQNFVGTVANEMIEVITFTSLAKLSYYKPDDCNVILDICSGNMSNNFYILTDCSIIGFSVNGNEIKRIATIVLEPSKYFMSPNRFLINANDSFFAITDNKDPYSVKILNVENNNWYTHTFEKKVFFE